MWLTGIRILRESLNENIAGFMYKCGICEERGNGYDKIIEVTGKNELLAPKIPALCPKNLADSDLISLCCVIFP